MIFDINKKKITATKFSFVCDDRAVRHMKIKNNLFKNLSLNFRF